MSTRRCTYGIAAAALLAWAVAATPLIGQGQPSQSARRLTAAEMAKVCADRATLQTAIAEAQSQSDLLRQVIANYGFERTAAEFDATTESLQGGLARQTGRPVVDAVVAPSQRTMPALELLSTKQSEMKKKLLEMLAGKASDSLKGFLEGLRPASPYDLRNLQQYLDVVEHLPMGRQLRAELIELAKSPDAQRRLLGYTKTLEVVNQLPTLYSMAASDSLFEIGWEGTMAAAGVVSPVLGALAKEVDWAGKNLYDAVTGQWANFQIDRLTTMTESQLADLKLRTDQLGAQTRRLRDARNALTALPFCDTTQLTSTRTTAPTPQPPRTGGGKGKWIALGAAGGGGAGYLLWCKDQPWQSACSWMNSGDDSSGGFSSSGGSSGGGSTGGGGGGGGGGTSNNQCLSTCNCIGSITVSCMGSLQGSCTFAPTPVGSGSGGSCPCRQGLACVNNRCESRNACQ